MFQQNRPLGALLEFARLGLQPSISVGVFVTEQFTLQRVRRQGGTAYPCEFETGADRERSQLPRKALQAQVGHPDPGAQSGVIPERRR